MSCVHQRDRRAVRAPSCSWLQLVATASLVMTTPTESWGGQSNALEAQLEAHNPTPETSEIRYVDPPSRPAGEIRHADSTKKQPVIRYAEADASSSPEIEFDSARGANTPTKAALKRQADDEWTTKMRERKSRRRFSVGVKLGPYVPEVDQAFNAERGEDALGAYAQIFGDTEGSDFGEATGQPKPGLMSMLSFEWHAFDVAGPLSLGLSAGFFRDEAPALLTAEEITRRRRNAELTRAKDPSADISEMQSVRAPADTNSFHVVPINISVGYRFSLLDRRTPVPLAPYMRAGLSYGVWWSVDGTKKVETAANGSRGRGASFGLHLDFGLMIHLDFLDGGGSSSAAVRPALFGEYRMSRIDGLGKNRKVGVGDDHWVGGVAVEF